MSRFFRTPFTLSTVAALALVTLIIGVLVGRLFAPTSTRVNANAPASGKRIDVIVKATDSQFWQAMLAGAQAAGKDWGVQVGLFGATSEADVSAQVRKEWRKIEGKIIASAITRLIARLAVGQGIQAIAGQKPVITRAKKSIANFKLREGVPIGAKVTLRGARMYEFFDRLVNVALPRVRDFKGVPPKGFDGRGNYAMGLREQLIFPEIVYDKIDKVRGMDIIFVTTARTDEDAKALLAQLGMPFREQ